MALVLYTVSEVQVFHACEIKNIFTSCVHVWNYWTVQHWAADDIFNRRLSASNHIFYFSIKCWKFCRYRLQFAARLIYAKHSLCLIFVFTGFAKCRNVDYTNGTLQSYSRFLASKNNPCNDDFRFLFSTYCRQNPGQHVSVYTLVQSHTS